MKQTNAFIRTLLGLVFCLALAGAAYGQNQAGSVEERRLRSAMQEEVERLRLRQEGIARRELELKTLEVEVDKKLAELKRVREELTVLLARKDEEEAKKLRELSAVYEKMESARAAQVLAALDENLAIALLGGMKSRSAGKILDQMEKSTAARLSAGFATLEGGRR